MTDTQIKIIRSPFNSGETCPECKDTRFVSYTTQNIEPEFILIRCLGCGSFAVHSMDDKTNQAIIRTMRVLEHLDLLKMEIPTELLQYYDKAMRIQKA